MSHWANFNPATDHFVQGFAETLPKVGEIHGLLIAGTTRYEQIIGAWWADGSQPDPLLKGRRAVALITRPVT